MVQFLAVCTYFTPIFFYTCQWREYLQIYKIMYVWWYIDFVSYVDVVVVVSQIDGLLFLFLYIVFVFVIWVKWQCIAWTVNSERISWLVKMTLIMSNIYVDCQLICFWWTYDKCVRDLVFRRSYKYTLIFFVSFFFSFWQTFCVTITISLKINFTFYFIDVVYSL